MAKVSAHKTSHIDKVEELRNKLKLKSLTTKNDFANKYGSALLNLGKKEVDISKLRHHSSKAVAAGALAGTLAVAAHTSAGNLNSGEHKYFPPTPQDVLAMVDDGGHIPAETKGVQLRNALKQILPEQTRPLTQQEEKYLEQVIKETTGVNAKASLEGEHLNTTYGKIGAEQHLRRYPGDTIANHTPQTGEYGADHPDSILKEDMAPGLGAWGYFAKSKDQLSPDLVEKEKWYSVAQTLYLPDWNTRQPYLRDWYKYRKLLIINTDNGKAVVTDLADSGPAAWTGKQFGGSPEVMDYLGGAKYKKGPVLVFFVDDPNNQIPLGPVEYSI